MALQENLGTPVPWYDPSTDYYAKAGIEKPLAPARPGGSMTQQSVPTSFGQLFGQDPSVAKLGLPSGYTTTAPTAPPTPTALPSVFAPHEATGGADYSVIIKALNQPIDPSVIAAGLTPVPSGHAMALPPSMTTPIAPYQHAPMDERQVVGKHAAAMQGMEHAFTGVANAVGDITKGIQEKKRQTTALGTERLMQAQQQIDAATLALKTAPPAQQAALQASIERNKKIMDTLLSDDKLRKSIEKGMQISFTDPSQNKTDDHLAVQEGRDAAAKSYSEQFASQMPQTVGPDPMAMEKMNLAIAQQQSSQKILATMLPRIMSAQSAMERTQYSVAARQMAQADQHYFDAWKLGEQFKNNVALRDIGHAYKIDEIQTNIAWSKQAMLELWRAQQMDPTKIMDFETKFYQSMSGDEARLKSGADSITEKIAELQLQLVKTTSKADRSGLEHQMQVLQGQADSTNQMLKNLQDYKDSVKTNIQTMKNLSMGGVGGSDAGSGSYFGGGQPPVSNFDPNSILPGLRPGITGLPPAGGAESDDTDRDEQE